MLRGMRVRIDRWGRIVVPKPIRERLGLRGGELLEIEEHDGLFELRPAPTEVELVETPQGPVARPPEPLPRLTDETVRDTLHLTRR
jgi:AbrB family looped-hinge helix DNA binding protein